MHSTHPCSEPASESACTRQGRQALPISQTQAGEQRTSLQAPVSTRGCSVNKKKCSGDPLLPPCRCTKPSQQCSLLPHGCPSHPACYECMVTAPKRVCSLLCKIKTKPFVIDLKRKLRKKPRFYFLSTSLLPELQVI